MQPVGISLAQRNPRSNLRMRALAEYLSIEHTVDDVTHRTGQNQGETNQVAILRLVRPFHQFHQINRNQYGSHDTEKCQEQFGKNLQTKSHTVVFREINIKPVGHMNVFMQIHVCLHRNFDKLVDNQHSCHHKSNQTSLSEKSFHLLQFAICIQKN